MPTRAGAASVALLANAGSLVGAIALYDSVQTGETSTSSWCRCKPCSAP
jgi:hypothetical protein